MIVLDASVCNGSGAAAPERVLAPGHVPCTDGTASDVAEYHQPTWGEFTGWTGAVLGDHDARSGDAGMVSRFGPSTCSTAASTCAAGT